MKSSETLTKADAAEAASPRQEPRAPRTGRASVYGYAAAGAAVALASGIGTWISVSPATALLLVAAMGILCVVGLVWQSLRTLSGEVVLAPELTEAAALSHRARRQLDEDKRRVLRTLKDLEQEYSLGRLIDADYKELADDLRQQAKEIMRKMDLELSAERAEAEALAAAFLEGGGVASRFEPRLAGKRSCAACETPNDADASFCKKCGGPLG